jgi:hypothetical protein
MLLASGDKEKPVCIWRACGDGHYEVILILPVEPLSQEAVGAERCREVIMSYLTH